MDTEKKHESQSGKHIKPEYHVKHEERKREEQHEQQQKRKKENTYLDKRFSRVCMDNKSGTMNLGISGRALILRTYRTHDLGSGHLRISPKIDFIIMLKAQFHVW